MDKVFAIIGGSGFYDFPELQNQKSHCLDTDFGMVEGLISGCIKNSKEDIKVYFLPRHGQAHHKPPHKINYRANIAALAQYDVTHVLAFNAVGGIGSGFSPGTVVLADQVIDYTYGRDHTFFDELSTAVEYTAFEEASDSVLRETAANVLSGSGLSYAQNATYGCTQGPRLETAAEIVRLARDGCDVVGMTMMPEAALAAEKHMAYLSLGFVVNWAAGVSNEAFSLNNVLALLDSSVPRIRELMLKIIRFF